MRIISGLFMSLFLGLILSAAACAHEATNQQDHIAVVGVGEVEATPDQAILTVRVSAQEPNLPAAKQLADKRYSKVLAVLAKAKIDERHIKATQIIAQPQYEWRNSKQVYRGELVSRTLQIIINDLEKVSPLMQSLVENEVSTIDGMTTGFQDREAMMQKALAAAADNAKSKASFLAKRLGRDLGSAFLITEYNESAPTMARAPEMARSSAMMADAAPPEMFGLQQVRARVNVSFNLL